MKNVNDSRRKKRNDTAEATKVVHALVRINELEKLVAWISNNSWVLQDRVFSDNRHRGRNVARMNARGVRCMCVAMATDGKEGQESRGSE
jgi:hypothetical protein